MTTRAPADWSTTRRPATTTTRNEMRIPVFFFFVFSARWTKLACAPRWLATVPRWNSGRRKKKEEKIPETPSQKMTTRHGVEVGGTTRSADLFLIRSKRLWLCVKINSREKKKNWATSCRTLPARREKKCVFMFWPMPLWRQRRPPSVANSLAFFHERSSPQKSCLSPTKQRNIQWSAAPNGSRVLQVLIAARNAPQRPVGPRTGHKSSPPIKHLVSAVRIWLAPTARFPSPLDLIGFLFFLAAPTASCTVRNQQKG